MPNLNLKLFLTMRNTTSILLFSLLAAIIITTGTSCNRNSTTKVNSELPAGMHAVKVIEVIQTNSYTYLQVFENNEKIWIAVASRESKPGDIIYYTDALEMRDFNSKELNRIFPVIYFVQDPSDSPETSKSPSSKGKPSSERVAGIEIEHIDGGITLAELFEKRAEFQNKTVKIRGLVVKVNSNIMGKNWVHLQDGTGSEEKYDLTITTQDKLEIGSIATFEGKIALEKDFGAGYAYDIIMEDATAKDVKATPVNM